MGVLSNWSKRKSPAGEGVTPRFTLHAAGERGTKDPELECDGVVLSSDDELAVLSHGVTEPELDELPTEAELVSMIGGEPAGAVDLKRIPKPPRQWGLDVLQAIDWKRLQELCQQVFVRRGFQAEPVDVGAFEGIDLVAHRDDEADRPGVAIACRRYGYPVPAKEVREFFGSVLRAGHEEAIFIATTKFNQAAHSEFGDDQRIQLVDGDKLLRVINELGEEAAGELLARVTDDGDGWTTPTCPECAAKMTLRRNRETGREFWECANYNRTGCLQRSYRQA